MIVIPTLRHRAWRPADGAGHVASGSLPEPDDPLVEAQLVASAGFGRAHVGSDPDRNARLDVRAIASDLVGRTSLALQFGLETTDRLVAIELLAMGAAAVAVPLGGGGDTASIAELAAEEPGRVILDLGRSSRPSMATRTGLAALFDLVSDLDGAPLAAVMVPARGGLETSLGLFGDLASAAPWPLLVQGESASLVTLRNLADRGIAGVVLDLVGAGATPELLLAAEEFAA